MGEMSGMVLFGPGDLAAFQTRKVVQPDRFEKIGPMPCVVGRADHEADHPYAG